MPRPARLSLVLASAGLADNVSGALVSAAVSLPLRVTSGGSDGTSYFVLNSALLGAKMAALPEESR